MKSNLEMLLEGCRKADEYEKKKAKEKFPVSLVICLVIIALSVVAIAFVGGIGAFLLLALFLLRK